MTPKFKISIPEPCHENWNTMAPAEKGKLCASCQKNVIDFGSFSDNEIMKYYNQNSKICGKFTSLQLQRNLILPKEKNSVWILATAATLAFWGLGNQTAKAQESVKTEQTDNLKRSDSVAIETNNKSIYTGIVFDENKAPIPGVTVVVKGTKVKTQTNFSGTFSINANKGAVLIFSFIGFENMEKKISGNKKITVDMIPEEIIMGEVIILKNED